jgi:multidrug efflux pump subunit AcrB
MRHAHPEKSFNVSRWALEHPALTRYLMVVLMLLGLAAYFQLGQDEDPPFTFRAMVVRTYWPGATAQQVAEQVTDKIERTLQEVPFCRQDPQLHQARRVADHFPDQGLQQGPATCPTSGTGAQEDRRHALTLPQGVIGPFLQRRVRRRVRRDLRAESDGFSYAELKTFADDVRQQLLRVPDVAKVELFGVQDEKLYIEISQKRLAQLGLDMNQVLAQLGQQNAVESRRRAADAAGRGAGARGGPVQRSEDLQSHADPRRLGHQLRLSDIATSARLRRPAVGEGAPPGQGGDCAGGVHGQGRRHHRAGQVA